MAKTNTGLVAYAKAQLGKPYWYGTFGQTASASLHAAKKKQYPKYYNQSKYKVLFTSQYGQRVHDCAGLIKGYLYSASATAKPVYNATQDKGANTLLNLAVTKGPIKTIPEVPGVLVHYTDHVGVYIGNGEVIEARGHDYGVVKTKLADRGWKNWSYCPFITYAKPVTTPTPALTSKNKVFKNTSGKALTIYADSALTEKIGTLYPGSSCTYIDTINGKVIILYKVLANNIYKVGFTDYIKGVG